MALSAHRQPGSRRRLPAEGDASGDAEAAARRSTLGIPSHEHSVTAGHEVLVCANLEHGLSITHQFLKFLNPHGLILSTNIHFKVQFLEQAFKAWSQKSKCQETKSALTENRVSSSRFMPEPFSHWTLTAFRLWTFPSEEPLRLSVRMLARLSICASSWTGVGRGSMSTNSNWQTSG